MQFDVIDTKTGAYPDVEKIALNEEWAKGLIYCDIDCFAMQEDGNLILIDDCGNFAYPPEKRFKIVLKKEPNEPLTPCDVCKFSPPSSSDGKPCCMCPAERRPPEGDCGIKDYAETCEECRFCDNTPASPPEGEDETE